ncbi:MAG: zinc-binding alcohol dehydrogenase [Planctomycetes bacterium]|nr:zinc-binding alcohol dehydrogenase [Planctomycetota bacterium]
MEITRIVFPEKGRVTVESKDETLDPKPGEVVIRTLYSLVSAGTELAKLTGLQTVPYPHFPGNRAVGKALAVGAGVKRVKPGDTVFAHTPHASHVKTSGFCVPVPDGVRLEHAPAVGLALVSMTALRVGTPELGDWAVVFGMGIVGNLAAQFCALSGLEVVAVDNVASRLEVAQRCGIRHVVNSAEGNVVERVLALTGPRGAEHVIEATGSPAVFETACGVAKRGGEVILVGSPRGEFQADLTAALNHVHLWREHGSLTLKGAHEWRFPLYDDGFAKHSMERNAQVIFRLMQQGRLRLDGLISHVVPAQDAARAYDGLLADKDTWVGVVFDWTDAVSG